MFGGVAGRGGLDADDENTSFKNGTTIKGTRKRAIDMYNNLDMDEFDPRT